MPGTVERSNYRLGAPKVAGIGFGEYGNERFQAMDTTGGSSPLGSLAPASPIEPPAPIDLEPQPEGLPGNMFSGLNTLPLTKAELVSLGAGAQKNSSFI